MKPRQQSFEFIDAGRRYVVRDIHRIDRADADLWNDSLHFSTDHRGRCNSMFLQPNATKYSESLRAFYVRDDETGKFWSAPYEPVQAEPKEFEFSIGQADLAWTVVRDGVKVELRVVVPRDDVAELWTAKVTNVSRRKRSVALYSFFPIGSIGPLVHQAWYDKTAQGFIYEYFPYYVRWQDYYKLKELRNLIFCASDARPTAVECNLGDFTGGRGLHDPAQLEQKRLGGGDARMEPAAAVFQFARTLEVGRSFTVNLVFAPVKDRAEMKRLRDTYLAKGGVDLALQNVRNFLDEYSPSVAIKTPDSDFDSYINRWQPRRALQIGRTLRYNLSPQGRNVIQDAMGCVYVDPATSRKWFRQIWVHQHKSGFLPHGMPMVGGVDMMPITTIPHRDTNVWGPMALQAYLGETGDWGLLHEVVQYHDDPRGATIYEHICQGLEFLLADRTDRGLSRLGQGDWNDPLNMAGKGDRGESIWLTEALSYALEIWADVAERLNDAARAELYMHEADNCRRAINDNAWDGEWYRRGTTDDGRWFGCAGDKHGAIFLNAQSWAIMCGAARGERIDELVKTVKKRLGTPAGPMTLAPAFTGMQDDIGKLTQKCPGTGENGSVYCHAVTFYAYALYRARRGEEAFKMLRTLLPGFGGNTIDRAGQVPLYVPNFFRGTPIGKTAGRSSHAPNTGTSSWYYRTAIAMLMGLRGEYDGLRIDPQLPATWKEASAWRRHRGAEFDIRITRCPDISETRVMLDGYELPGNLIPPQEVGSRHEVVVNVPK